MIRFTILKQSRTSGARLGILKTPHGEIETPCLVPVATQAVVKTLTAEEAAAAKCQVLIANTFHLHLRPGETLVKRMGGLHEFMHWPRPLMTDSGGFQVFSLGFGKDLGTNKILKTGGSRTAVTKGQQPNLMRITEEGVFFRSPLDGAKLFLGPKESIRIQESLGADIMFAFDECPPPQANRAYLEVSLKRTHRWARASLTASHSPQALFGIVQGGRYKSFRIESARFIGALPFDGFGIGGEFGNKKRAMERMLGWVTQGLPVRKPRHLLGIGYPEDLRPIIRAGLDTFDCTVPTHYARHGVAFTSAGKLSLEQSRFLKERAALDRTCGCSVCRTYTRSYLAHLIRAKEITGLKLLTFHNLFYFNTLIEHLRRDIKRGTL